MDIERDLWALPENERAYFRRAIAARAAWWRLSKAEQARVVRECYLRFMKAALTAPAGDGDDDAEDDDDDDGDWPAT